MFGTRLFVIRNTIGCGDLRESPRVRLRMGHIWSSASNHLGENTMCVEALPTTRRDARVALKCLFRSLVIRKKGDNLEMVLEAKLRGNWKRIGYLITTEQYP